VDDAVASFVTELALPFRISKNEDCTRFQNTARPDVICIMENQQSVEFDSENIGLVSGRVHL
jgi:hypothetical protein